MVYCDLGREVKIVKTTTECDALGGIVVDDPYAKQPMGCFVRNVLTRILGGLILDIGSADGIHPEFVNKLDIPPSSKNKKKKAADRKDVLSLTPARRKSLAARVTRSILNLAATYQTALSFRDQLLLTTPRGRQLKTYYDKYLNEIYVVANQDQELFYDSALAWLGVYDFVRGMVAVATAPTGSQTKSGPKLAGTAYRKSMGLMARFRKGSRDEGFRKLLEELETELAEYEGLSPEQAVVKLSGASAKR